MQIYFTDFLRVRIGKANSSGVNVFCTRNSIPSVICYSLRVENECKNFNRSPRIKHSFFPGIDSNKYYSLKM